MSSPPLVSVIVPNYNHARFLPRRLDSILGQTFTDFELIILDDASTDDSVAVISRYLEEPRIRFQPHARNSGSPFVQWNRGVAAARGALVWIAESDDEAEPGLLAELVGLLEARPDVGLAYCRSRRIDAEGREITGGADADLDLGRWSEPFFNRGPAECREQLLWKNTIPNASAVVFRRKLFIQAGGAPETMRLSGDWATWVAILLRSHVAYSPHRLNHHRHHSGTIRASHDGWRYFDERYLVQRIIIQAGLPTPDDFDRLVQMAFDECSLRIKRASGCGRIAAWWAGCRKYSPLIRRSPRSFALQIARRARNWSSRRFA